MRRYPLINFSTFSLTEFCDFIADRLYADVQQLLDELQKNFDQYPGIFEEEDNKRLLPFLFLQLSDQCRQLLRLETLALFPHIRNQLKNGLSPAISPKTMQQLEQAQKVMLSHSWRIGITLNFYVAKNNRSVPEQIIANDLHLLSSLLQDWVNLVQNHLFEHTATSNTTMES